MTRVIEPGSVIDGFRLGERLHLGTMASIYRLQGTSGALPLIMKIPRLGPGEKSVNVVSFEVCRMVLGALAQGTHHPTLVAYGDIETTPYLVMEYIEGVRLDDWLVRAPMAADEIARLGAALALALSELHLQDVVHLDLKPTNVLYRPTGETVLIDFGLAHHSHFPDLLAEELRIPVGNWVYMAPEQVLGVRCDPRSDIYAMGAILYELATAKPPWGKPQSIRELHRRLYRTPVPPRAIAPATPDWLQEVILRCLEIDARDRYASAREVALALANPTQVELTARSTRLRQPGALKRLSQRLRASRFQPAPCPPPTMQRQLPRVVVVAIDPELVSEPLSDALRDAARAAVAADPRCRIACVAVVPPAEALLGEGDEYTATGRQIRRLVDLRHWARPLRLPEEQVTFHVLEADKPAAALIDYATMNDVDHVLIGAPRGAARKLTGVCAEVAAEVRCTVTVVRPRTEEGVIAHRAQQEEIR